MPSLTPTTIHEKLCEDALNAINLVFGDNSVDPTVTLQSLLDLKEEVTVMIQALGEDLGTEAQAMTDEELLDEDEEAVEDSSDE
jgi:hypothetical protein